MIDPIFPCQFLHNAGSAGVSPARSSNYSSPERPGRRDAGTPRVVPASETVVMSDTPVVLLNGARQTGKTKLAQSLPDRTGARYFTLDDLSTLRMAARDPNGFIRNLKGPVIIDEIQRAPELFPAI